MKNLLQRTIAYLIDSTLCFLLIMVVIQWGILSHIREGIGLSDDWFKNPWNAELYVILTISLPVWLYFMYFDSYKTKGSLGKRIFKLRVTDTEYHPISMGKSFWRTVCKLAPWELAHIGVLFPSPMYFENDPNLRIVTIVGLVLFVAFMGSIWKSPKNQSFYDLWLGTMVQTKP